MHVFDWIPPTAALLTSRGQPGQPDLARSLLPVVQHCYPRRGAHGRHLGRPPRALEHPPCCGPLVARPHVRPTTHKNRPLFFVDGDFNFRSHEKVVPHTVCVVVDHCRGSLELSGLDSARRRRGNGESIRSALPPVLKNCLLQLHRSPIEPVVEPASSGAVENMPPMKTLVLSVASVQLSTLATSRPSGHGLKQSPRSCRDRSPQGAASG